MDLDFDSCSSLSITSFAPFVVKSQMKNLISSMATGSSEMTITARRPSVQYGSPSRISRGNDSCTFVTVFLGILNINTGEMSYTNAGHNPPLKISKKDGITLLNDAMCPAIGMDEDFTFSSKTILLQSQDMICMYTDGVTEAFDEKRQMFSEERLIEEVSGHREYTASKLADEVFQKVQSFSEKMPQADDITILNVRYSP